MQLTSVVITVCFVVINCFSIENTPKSNFKLPLKIQLLNQYFNPEKEHTDLNKKYLDKEEDADIKTVINVKAFQSLEVVTHEGKEELPENFDARLKWKNCTSIGKVYDQGRCSAWSIAIAAVASDRTCIHTSSNVLLSEVDFNCCKNCYDQQFCNNGMAENVFDYWIKNGIVTKSCKPFNIDQANGPCTDRCDNENIDYKKDKHFGSKQYRMDETEDNIKRELYENGPIAVVFWVYENLNMYKTGVYSKVEGYKSMHYAKLIGYGVENGTSYWLVVNSWGYNWGEKGLFKIKRYLPEVQFESVLMTGLPV